MKYFLIILFRLAGASLTMTDLVCNGKDKITFTLNKTNGNLGEIETKGCPQGDISLDPSIFNQTGSIYDFEFNPYTACMGTPDPNNAASFSVDFSLTFSHKLNVDGRTFYLSQDRVDLKCSFQSSYQVVSDLGKIQQEGIFTYTLSKLYSFTIVFSNDAMPEGMSCTDVPAMQSPTETVPGAIDDLLNELNTNICASMKEIVSADANAGDIFNPDDMVCSLDPATFLCGSLVFEYGVDVNVTTITEPIINAALQGIEAHVDIEEHLRYALTTRGVDAAGIAEIIAEDISDEDEEDEFELTFSLTRTESDYLTKDTSSISHTGQMVYFRLSGDENLAETDFTAVPTKIQVMKVDTDPLVSFDLFTFEQETCGYDKLDWNMEFRYMEKDWWFEYKLFLLDSDIEPSNMAVAVELELCSSMATSEKCTAAINIC